MWARPWRSTALGALGSIKGLMDTRGPTDADTIEAIKTHLLSKKEVSSEFFERARQLSGVKSSGFIMEGAFAVQIALMVADVVPDYEGPSRPGAPAGGATGGAVARDTIRLRCRKRRAKNAQEKMQPKSTSPTSTTPLREAAGSW